MSDDHDRAPGSSTGGKRRAPEPAEQPRRRRRSMEGAGGVSVSDLVERHSGSRSNLVPIPEADEPDEVPRHQGGRRAAQEPPSRHAAEPAPDVHRNVISTGGRRSAPELPPEPPRQPEPVRRPEPPKPQSRRNRTATHAVPADVLAQSTGQPVDRPQRAVREDDDRPRSVVDLLGPEASAGKRAKKETFAESASRGRADAKRSLPGNPPPPPARHTDEPPAGRRARQEPEPTGRRALPEPPALSEPTRSDRIDNRRPALSEPTRSEPQRRPAALSEPTRSEPRRGPARPTGTPDFPLDDRSGRRQPEPFSENRPPSPGRRGPQDRPFPPAGEAGRPRRQGEVDENPLEAPRGTGSQPAPGRPLPTGQHPVPGRRPEPGRTGAHPLPNRRPDGQHPEPHSNGNRRPDHTGAHPAPLDHPNGPVNGNRPADQDRRPDHTGAHPVPEHRNGPIEPHANGNRRSDRTGAPEHLNGRGPAGHANGNRRPDTGAHPVPEHRNGPAEPNGNRRPDHTGAHPIPGHRNGHGPAEPHGNENRRPDTGAHPVPEHLTGRGPAEPHRNGPIEPHANGSQRPDHTGAHPVPGHRNGPAEPNGSRRPDHTGAHPIPDHRNGPAEPHSNGNRRPDTGSHPVPEHLNGNQRPDHTGAHPAPGHRNGPIEPHLRPDHTGAHPAPEHLNGRGPAEHPNGRRTGAHPVPAPEANRQGPLHAPQGTGGHPHPGPPRRPELDGPQGTGAHPIPGGPGNSTGSHPIPQRTGAHPVPGRGETSGAHPVVDQGREKPRIPSQQPPGQSSMPPVPEGKLTPPPNVSPQELVGLTTEMEPIGEAVQKRRRVDQTLARFSKVHDEMRAEEKAKKSKRLKTPWGSDAAELDEKLDELAAAPAEPTVVVEPLARDESADTDERDSGGDDEDPKPKRRWSLLAKVFSGSAAVLVFTATGVGWGIKEWANNNIEQVRALDPGSAAIQNAEGQRGDENFLLVGSDTRDGAEAEEGVGDANSVPGARSDTVMIAHIPADRSRVVIVSFPRDLEINRPDCERFDAKAAKYTGEHSQPQKNAKMNTAYEVGGPLCVTKVVQEISGLQITRFVGIDFSGFRGMVDAVDGVNVCVEKPMFDTTLNKWIVKDAGTEVLLRGEQALDFVRARHVRGDPTSDYGRIKRQQRFLSSLLRKAMSGQVLLDPAKLTSFTGEVAKSTFGDNIEVDSLMRLGQSLQSLEAGRVTFITVPTVGMPNSRNNEVLRKDDADRLFRAIINKEPLPGEAPPPPAGTGTQQQAAPIREAVDPKTLKIQVLNGGNATGGIARRTADKLAEFGFTVVQVNPTAAVPRTVVRYGKGHEAAAQALASAVPGAQLQEDPSMSAALVLVLGPEFTGQVVAPGTPGAAVPTPENKPLPSLSTVNGSDVTCA
ncbi:LCP family protein required for cell wall assembly [Actinokineospora baliensis]|uniref:LCP family protein n=1 Tax=Actinokineospora baliensis TaxID=547056 RepID=UPI0019560E19|nr:LCP family protein [Actinokineospora baliensis]MBM7770684.1 LCP family protein required for cell wall assembly [Actinokineospora baliensis]